MLTCFSFITLGYHFCESLAAVGAIFGGMILRGILPKEKLYQNERAVEFIGYVFLSPIFSAVLEQPPPNVQPHFLSSADYWGQSFRFWLV